MFSTTVGHAKIGGGMAEPKKRISGKETRDAITDRTRALELSLRLAAENRLSFARSFSAEIAIAYARANSNLQRAAIPAPPRVASARLGDDARLAANEIAESLQPLPAADACYAVGSLYSTLLPEAFRAQHGIFYTPPALVDCLLAMAEEAGIDWRSARVLDPACGGGAFLVGVALRMMGALANSEPALAWQSIIGRLRGFDTDPFGAWLAEVAVRSVLPDGSPSRRSDRQVTKVRDSLAPPGPGAETFDLVVGNPPYGRVGLSAERRRQYARGIYGHANLYGVFTEAALHWLKPAGIVGYVTPTSMLSGLYYKALRSLLAADAPPLAVNFVSERDGVFANVLQETMLATYRKGGGPTPAAVGFIEVTGEGHQVKRRQAGTFTLPAAAHAPWLLPRSTGQERLTRRLRSMPHRLSDYGYGVSTGPLVWNRHKDQFRERAAKSSFPVVWAESVTSDGRFVWRSEKRNHAPWFDARRPKDDWLIVTQPCVLLQRTTAKEQARRLIAAELPDHFVRGHKGVIVENHLNMIRALGGEPSIPVAVMAALLNSRAVDAAFRCLNGSVAVSAFELEELPLPPPASMAKLVRATERGAGTAEIEAIIAAAYGERDVAAAA